MKKKKTEEKPIKIYISIDLEGLGNVVSWMEEETHREEVRRLMTEEANAVVRGIYDSARPIAVVVIADSHDSCLNLLAEKLDPRAHLIKGTLRRFSMMEGVDGTFDRVFLVGYHTRAGIGASQMDHTFSNRVVHELRVGDRLLGETELSALVAGSYRVPVALVTGDQALETEVRETLPWAVFCRTKTALSRYAALSAHPEQIRALLAEKAREATEKDRQSLLFFTLPAPYTAEVALHHAAMADAASILPCYERKDGRTLTFRAANALELYRYFVGLVRLASTAV